MSLDKLFANLRTHTLALFCGFVAVLFWKDYLTHPRHAVTREHLVAVTGELSFLGELISLPSGSGRGTSVGLKDAPRAFDIPGGIDRVELAREVPEGAQVTLLVSPEEDLSRPGEAVIAFSLKHGDKEYVSHADLVPGYNAQITSRLRPALVCTLASFVAFGLVWFVKKRFSGASRVSP